MVDNEFFNNKFCLIIFKTFTNINQYKRRWDKMSKCGKQRAKKNLKICVNYSYYSM